MKMSEFAFCNNYDIRLRNLSLFCPEKWSFGDNTDNSILKNYIYHTFMKLYQEGKIIEQEKYSIFNTGLFTIYYEEIFAYFVINKNPDKQKWFLDGFYTKYQLNNLSVYDEPERANYFTDPSALVFDTNCEIIPQYNHIFGTPVNLDRIPESVRLSSNRNMLFDGSIARAKNMINANYKNAIPQYYKDKIQLLIPIFLVSERIPDLTLVLTKNEEGNKYLGHTCLTLDMAYNNARLIARPDSDWLCP